MCVSTLGQSSGENSYYNDGLRALNKKNAEEDRRDAQKNGSTGFLLNLIRFLGTIVKYVFPPKKLTKDMRNSILQTNGWYWRSVREYILRKGGAHVDSGSASRKK